jgi:hypothetical protein
MPSGPRESPVKAGVAAALVIAGLVLAGLYRIVAGTQSHAFSPGAQPPTGIHVTTGHTYEISVPGGVQALRDHGVDPGALQCSWSSRGSGSQLLQVAASGLETKATNVIATFTAPVTGELTIECAGWGPVFVDDADSTPADTAGWILLLAVIALATGGALGVSVLAARWVGGGRSAGPGREMLAGRDHRHIATDK